MLVFINGESEENMNSMVIFLGRLSLSSIFLISGISKIGAFSATVAKMENAGVPFASFSLFIAILLEILGSLSVLTGYRSKWGSVFLMTFLLITTYFFHFKPAFDGQFNVIDQTQLIHVLKNLSIFGGLLLIYGHGPGKMSLDRN